MTVPLLTNSHGQKFGKSEGNAIWINKSRTSNVWFEYLIDFISMIITNSSYVLKMLIYLYCLKH